MITVVNKKTHVPTDYDVYIGRGSVLGNPYSSLPAHIETKAEFRCETREESISKFNEYIEKEIKDKNEKICSELNRIWKLAKAGDINLVCYCAPKSCHGHIIKKIIESVL